MPHGEHHRSERLGWLRAAVLGANDGLISTSSLAVGVASAQATSSSVVVAVMAGLVAGALSMAAGEYVSVSSQADTERADLNRERHELAASPAAEQVELAAIYQARGLTPELARQVAEQLMARDALGAHARDELGLTAATMARPVQAALASAAAFAVGAAPALLFTMLVPISWLPVSLGAASILMLAALGAAAARLGRAPIGRAVVRVTFWGLVAIGTTALVGHLFAATL